jgi:PadR family transcriptional regulator, regulatory protein PadR
MSRYYPNWQTQIRKGYIELCVLNIIHADTKTYGFKLLSTLTNHGHPVKEGTLYPMLNRMKAEGLLTSFWETNENNAHPRKYYSLSECGLSLLQDMRNEFNRMHLKYQQTCVEI